MTPLDETTLLAYVDGQLSPDDARRVEAALQDDASARVMVEQLRQTPGRLREVFDRALDQPLPPTLAADILRQPVGRRAIQRIRMTSAVAVAGLLFGLGLWAGAWLDSAQRSPIAAEPWVEAVAEYQALYGRATVNQADANGIDLHHTAARLTTGFGHSVDIPDLRAHGLTFKRGQLLEFAGQPLVQLVYLPTQGKPIAYCLLRTRASDLAPTTGSAKGMRYVHWRANGIAYLLIGDATAAEIEKLAAAARAS